MTQPIAAPRFWYEIVKEGSFCDICKRDIRCSSVCFHDFCPYILGHRGEAEVNKLTKQHEQELSETLDALDKQSALARFQAVQGAQDAIEFEDAEDWDELEEDEVAWEELEEDEVAWEEELRGIEENYDDISPENS